ncbi:2Fe-2S iron-sulfur cluster-binding protein [Microbacterium sp. Leaf288]|uniref:2Fe-2S iron-sulfur cluster-binding protein n=1 Tax=Microbacterium sp. Leaf288 TaxID=1736323 RepID=UPI001F2B9946|nr:2Fe-2S iron-sulfur cluster-binding protein [Microbacterium sp. Leaf288]
MERLTDDSVAVTLDVPDDQREEFAHTPGQHLVVLHDGIRRTYSIASVAGKATLRIGVKEVPDGAVSTWINRQLKVGDQIPVMAPTGTFTLHPDAENRNRYAAIVAGSGITPVMSLAASILEAEPGSSFVLIYGNRATSTVMFLEDLEDLKNQHPDRFEVHHVLSREQQASDVLTGRLDRGKIDELLERFAPSFEGVRSWFLCGPFGVVESAREALAAHGVPATSIHHEVFFVDDAPALPVRAVTSESTRNPEVTATLSGRRLTVQVASEQETVLDAVLRARPDAPYACRGGVCGTCRALLVSGSAEMVRSYALEEPEREAGYVLTCQAYPTSEKVAVDFDR